MKTFLEFLNEIAVARGAEPVRRPAGFRSHARIEPSDESHGVIPLVIHPKAMSVLDDLGADHLPDGHPFALSALSRLMGQPRDGSPAVTRISNVEADDLRRLARDLVADSDKVMGSPMHPSTKDDAFRWSAFANAILGAVDNGERMASSRKIS